jgi:putative hemolysin
MRDEERENTMNQPMKINLIALMVGILVITSPVAALLNPSAVYCTAMGYPYEPVQSAEGESGLCRMPDNQYIDSWKFLRGEDGQKFNYCTRMGYATKTSRDLEKCAAIGDAVCAVCVLPDKREVQVTTLMGLRFSETSCGDGRCVITETSLTCPRDCPQSGRDSICQRITDLTCDPDCIGGTGDPDCTYLGNPLLTLMVVLVIIVFVGGAVGYFLKKQKKKPAAP